MPTKRCSWGTCNSDSRYKQKPHMEEVSFFPFPKPWIDKEKCRKWIIACGRPKDQLNENMIAGHHCVCLKVNISLSNNKIIYQQTLITK